MLQSADRGPTQLKIHILVTEYKHYITKGGLCSEYEAFVANIRTRGVGGGCVLSEALTFAIFWSQFEFTSGFCDLW